MQPEASIVAKYKSMLSNDIVYFQTAKIYFPSTKVYFQSTQVHFPSKK